MFKKFTGYNIVQAIHAAKKTHRYKLGGYLRVMLAVIVSLSIATLPTKSLGIEGLSVVEQRVIATFVFAAIMWLSEAVPSWCTSVVIITVMLFTTSTSAFNMFQGTYINGELVKHENLIPYKDLMHCFADPTIMLFLGGFVLAIGLTAAKVDLYLARIMLKPFGTKSENVLLGFILVTALFSAFVSNTATAAMMIAFLTPVLKSLPADGKGRIALALAIPLGANIGGIATPIGTPPNTIALGYLSESLGYNISFGEWMLKMTPFVIILLLVGWVFLRVMFPFKQKTIEVKIDGELEPSYKTWVVIATFVITVLLWCWPTETGLNSYTIAFVPLASFCLFGIVNRRDLEEINWSVIWMVAGGFSLGVAMNKSGLGQHLIDTIPFGEWPAIIVMLIAGLVCFGFSNFISHSAAASLLVPVLGLVAGAMTTTTGDTGIAARMLICVALASSVSMILPISTPPNAIAHSTGMIEQKDMIKTGIFIGIIGLTLGYFWMYLMF